MNSNNINRSRKKVKKKIPQVSGNWKSSGLLTDSLVVDSIDTPYRRLTYCLFGFSIFNRI